MNYRNIFLPYDKILQLSITEIEDFGTQLAPLKEYFNIYLYCILNDGYGLLFDEIEMTEKDILIEQYFQINGEIIELFRIYFEDEYHSKPNDIFVVDQYQFVEFNQRANNQMYLNSIVLWKDSFDRVLKQLGIKNTTHAWFNTSPLLNNNEILFIQGAEENENAKIKELIKSEFSDYNIQTIDELIPESSSLQEYIEYFRPDINHVEFAKISSSNQLSTLLIKAIKQSFGLLNCDSPLLIKQTGIQHAQGLKYYAYHIYFVDFKTINFIELGEFLNLNILNIPQRFLNYSEVCDEPFFPPEDEEIDREYAKLSNIVWDKLNFYDEKNAKLLLARVLKQALQAETKEDILQIAEATKPTPKRVSPLKITDTYKIFLPQYNNLEIKMGKLPKALYFLFICHPEGIDLKQIGDYKDELFHLYLKVTNYSDTEKLRKNINLLTNLQDNSIYVNLARIKSGFTKVMSLEYAEIYLPNRTGSYKRAINLPHKLIQISPKL